MTQKKYLIDNHDTLFNEKGIKQIRLSVVIEEDTGNIRNAEDGTPIPIINRDRIFVLVPEAEIKELPTKERLMYLKKRIKSAYTQYRSLQYKYKDIIGKSFTE